MAEEKKPHDEQPHDQPHDEPHEHWTREQALEVLRAAKEDHSKIDEWNAYRRNHPDWTPDLSSRPEPADLSRAVLWGSDLSGANLSAAELRRAYLWEARLRETRLAEADLSGANLCGADLSGAVLWGSNLSGAKLVRAKLRKANLRGADLTGANLLAADLGGANIQDADLSGASLRSAELQDTTMLGVRYDRKRMRGNCRGVRGLDSCSGNGFFVRDARDQDFIDTLRWEWCGTWRMILFRLWGLIDYGRSLHRTAVGAFGFAVLFGFAYLIAALFGHPLVAPTHPDTPDHWLTPFYFSIVTYTTLGFGDVTPASVAGMIVVASEVIFGYVTLGLLIAILANKVARRAA